MRRYLYAFGCGILLAGTVACLLSIGKKNVNTPERFFETSLVVAADAGPSVIVFQANGKTGVIDYGAATAEEIVSLVSAQEETTIEYYICASDTFDYHATITQLKNAYEITNLCVNAVNPTAFPEEDIVRVTEPVSFADKNFELLLTSSDTNIKKEEGDCAIVAALQLYGTSFLIADGVTALRIKEMERYESRPFSCVVLTNSAVGEEMKKGFLDRFYPNILVTETVTDSSEIPCFSPDNGVISFYLSENGASVIQ